MKSGFLLALALSFAACGKAPVERALIQDLVGRWEVCVQVGSGEHTHSKLIRLVVDPSGSAQGDVVLFSDGNTKCTGSVTSSSTVKYSVQVGSATSVVEGARNVDFLAVPHVDGQSLYTIYRIDGSKLYLGKSTTDIDGTSIEKRHVALDYEQAFIH